MRELKEILRLKFDKSLSEHKALSNRQIGQSTNTSPGTVSYYVRAFQASGLCWEEAQHQNHDELSKQLKPHCQQLREPGLARFEIDYEYIHTELKQKGVTLQLLWEEYKQACPVQNSMYSYPQYCRYYRKWRKKLKPSFRHHYIGGEKCFVDYAGPKVPVYNQKTGEVQLYASIFVGVLAASSYTFAMATPSHTKADWLDCHVNMFQFLGGVPQLVVPDNEKAGTNKACKYEPELNPHYAMLAHHYNTTILPTRPYAPRDKGSVENAVLIVERWILARIRKLRFFSLAELNETISCLLIELNQKPFQKLAGCRETLYLQVDKPALIPLPCIPFEYADIKWTKVGLGYHVYVNTHYYSVPYTLMHKRVEYRLGSRTLEVFYQGTRVASHPRNDAKGKYSTLDAHMPEAHKQHAQWTPQGFEQWGKAMGEAAHQVAHQVIEVQSHPECCYRIHLGFKHLVKLYGQERFNAACAYALRIDGVSYKSMASILKSQLDKTQPLQADNVIPETPSPKHQNLRGAAYYLEHTEIMHHA